MRRLWRELRRHKLKTGRRELRSPTAFFKVWCVAMVLCAGVGHAHAHAQLVRARGIAPTAHHGEPLVNTESTTKIAQGFTPTTTTWRTTATSMGELENALPATANAIWAGNETEHENDQHGGRATRRLQGAQHPPRAHPATRRAAPREIPRARQRVVTTRDRLAYRAYIAQARH